MLLSALAAALAAALPSTRPFGELAAAALALAAFLLRLLRGRSRAAEARSVAELLPPALDPDRRPGAEDRAVTAPSRLAEAASRMHPSPLSLGLRDLFERLDADLALLKRSAVKFDLFASDIHFSASHLAELASRDLAMLGELRGRVGESRKLQEAANSGLVALRTKVAEASARATAQAGRASTAREDLAGLVAASTEAARLAEQGLEEVAATGGVAGDLAGRVAKLDAAAKRETAEAGRIAEMLSRISDIVDRTHVLATNASIEAARAGARGAGFAVIAAEVRALAASSRAALEEIDPVLRSVEDGVRESGDLAALAAEGSTRLSASFARASGTFDAIKARIGGVAARLGSFDQAFAAQAADSASAASATAQAAEELAGFAESFASQARAYEAVTGATAQAEDSAREAERSARILAQLAGYLRHGGRDRDRTLRRYAADGRARERRLGRSEGREDLVYNLDVADSRGEVIGYLGDLSPSGLLLVSTEPRRIGERLRLSILMPHSAEGETSVPVAATVRRVEIDGGEHRLGCSLEAGDGSRARAAAVIASLSLRAVAPQGNVSLGLAADGGSEEAELVEEVEAAD